MDKLFDEHLPKFFLLLCAVYLWACQLAFTAPGVIGALIILGVALWREHELKMRPYRNFAGAVDHRWTIVKTSIVGNVEQYRLVDESVWFTESGEDMDPLRSSRYHYAGFALPSKQTDQAALAESGTKPKPEVTIEKAGMSSCSPKITIAVSDIDWEALQRSSSVDFLLKKSS
jgi:hypothetical protein